MPPSQISLSTHWLSHRHDDGYSMLREAANLGFTSVELSHGISMPLVSGILGAVQGNLVKISSVHNFCPLPPGISGPNPNCFEPTAALSGERQMWELYSKKTIDFAVQLGADVVVMHLGSMNFFLTDPCKALFNLSEGKTLEELSTSKKFQKTLQKLKTKREQKARTYRDRLFSCLEIINAYAHERGIRIGVENREHPLELPLDNGFREILDTFPSCGYWHDSGHAAIKERLGFVNQEDLLRNNADKLLGFHLKDMTPDGVDNRAIGAGVIDFSMVAAYIEPQHKCVLEVSPNLTPDEVVSSREKLETLTQNAPIHSAAVS